jgi:electron transfer flavoprotein alpha subunit
MVLLSDSLNSLDVAPRLAYKLDGEIITDCVDIAIEPDTNHLLCTKPVYGAKFISVFKLVRRPYIVTFRSKSIKPIAKGSHHGKIIHFDARIDQSVYKLKKIKEVKEETIGLSKANAIIAGGRGIQGNDGIAKLRELKKVLKRYFKRVELGASRPLVDARLMPSSCQIGLTGEKVAPELYIAVGISGSLQHVTGISGAKKIIAINNNPKAPIFQVADYGIVANYEDVLPTLARKLEELE